MNVIDIDRLKSVDSHVHYLKEYQGRVILLDKQHQILRHPIQFSIEYTATGETVISVKFSDSLAVPVSDILPKIKKRINELDKNGILANLKN